MKTFNLILLLFLAGSCSPVRVVSTDMNQNVDFSKYSTFAFYPDDTGLASEPHFQDVKNAIGRELEQRGLTQHAAPDLWVNIATDSEQKTQTRETDYRDAPIYMGTRNYHWQSEEIVVREYEEGTVKIDVVDAKTDNLVWQGIAAGTITGDQAKMKARIDKAINAVFSKFPIKESHD